MQITSSFSTKFRAFQLDSPGSLFSYYKPGQYTLIEARIPKGGINVLKSDLAYHNKERIDVLHITSWDSDHCTYQDLQLILNQLRPNLIEVPEYRPTTADGIQCWNLIHGYEDVHQPNKQNVRIINQGYINSLASGEDWAASNIVYPSMYNCNNKNNMSLIQLFRSNGFNVLSVGDCESPEISEALAGYSFVQNEVDVLILAHHGADNGFTTGKFLDVVKPRMAVATSDYNNLYGHPHQNIRNLLNYRGIELMTTKEGDVIIHQLQGMDSATAANMVSNNEIVDSRKGFVTKKAEKKAENIIKNFTW